VPLVFVLFLVSSIGVFSKGMCPVFKCAKTTIQSATCYDPFDQYGKPLEVEFADCPAHQVCQLNFFPKNLQNQGPWMNMGNQTVSCSSVNDYELIYSGLSKGSLVEGDPCEEYSDCTSKICEDHVCVGLPEGALCVNHEQCNSATFCDENYVCAPLRQVGEPCRDGFDCAEGISCNLDSTCVLKVSLPSGSYTNNDELCQSSFSLNNMCEDLKVLNTDGRCNYSENNACEYVTSETNTKVSIENTCVCNPDGSGYDYCQIDTDSPQKKVFNLIRQKVSSYGCHNYESGTCPKIPNKVWEIYTLANYAQRQIDFTQYPCLRVRINKDNDNETGVGHDFMEKVHKLLKKNKHFKNRAFREQFVRMVKGIEEIEYRERHHKRSDSSDHNSRDSMGWITDEFSHQ
jgi:hypothetical protein